MNGTATNHSRIRALIGLGLLTSAATLGGCEWDSFIDPSVVGRWEHTPTTVPILERIGPIEGPEDQFVEYSEVQADDLIPELVEYRVAPGDTLEVTLFDLLIEGQPEIYSRQVDTRGQIALPQLGEIYVDGLSAVGIKEAIETEMRSLVADPLVSVQVLTPRQTTYNIIGGFQGAGTFFIPTADFRLLEALTNSGGFQDNLDYFYVIRQSPLTDDAAGTTTGEAPAPTREQTGEDVLDVLDELSEDLNQAVLRPMAMQPEGEAPEPLVDLVDPSSNPERPGERAGWVFEDGQWVRVQNSSGTDAEDDPRSQLVTQRIIRVPADRLLAGDARFNMVIRPGDTIRIPAQATGSWYIDGQINRVGVYALEPGLTLTRAVTSAGGLGGLAIPERIDLTRMVGNDRQATIRLNLRAIAEGTEPDVFLKENDRVVIGTNFWATPLAIVRNGLRFSYGFGFLLDRNFGNDVFGPPPTDNRF